MTDQIAQLEKRQDRSKSCRVATPFRLILSFSSPAVWSIFLQSCIFSALVYVEEATEFV